MTISTAPQVIVVSDPWATVAQFAGIVVASLISIWTVRAAAKSEEKARTRMLVSEYLAVTDHLDDQILRLQNEAGPQRSKGPMGKPYYDTELAKIALERYEPALVDLKTKGAIASLHLDSHQSDYISEVTRSYEGVAEVLREVSVNGGFNEESIDLRQQTLHVNRGELVKIHSEDPPKEPLLYRLFTGMFHKITNSHIVWLLKGKPYRPGVGDVPREEYKSSPQYPIIFVALIIVVALTVLLIWQPWRPSADAFRQSDSAGYSACRSVELADGAGGSIRRGHMGDAARSGLQSSNPEVRALVDNRSGVADGAPLIRDHGDFKSACKKAGYQF